MLQKLKIALPECYYTVYNKCTLILNIIPRELCKISMYHTKRFESVIFIYLLIFDHNALYLSSFIDKQMCVRLPLNNNMVMNYVFYCQPLAAIWST